MTVNWCARMMMAGVPMIVDRCVRMLMTERLLLTDVPGWWWLMCLDADDWCALMTVDWCARMLMTCVLMIVDWCAGMMMTHVPGCLWLMRWLLTNVPGYWWLISPDADDWCARILITDVPGCFTYVWCYKYCAYFVGHDLAPPQAFSFATSYSCTLVQHSAHTLYTFTLVQHSAHTVYRTIFNYYFIILYKQHYCS